MINFCVEPKKPCRKNPIGELDFKIDKCYSSIYSRLCCHENDSVSHISQEERDEWNGKASNSALLYLQNQLNEIAGDGDNSIKKEILIEVSRQIAGAITDLNIEEYAKKKYVDDAISNIDFDQYVTKENADSTYLNKADYIKFDPTNYYTIAQIQKIIEDSTIGKDYPIESFTLEHNELILTQKNGGQFRVALSESVFDGGINADYIQHQLLNYIKKNTLSKLIINDKTYSIESGRDIKIPISGASSSIDYTKFGYSKSYFKKHTSNSVAPSKPSANRPPEDGSGWVDDAPNQEAGYYIWMTQVFINGNGQYGEYTNPICLTGTAGENAVSYDIKTSTSTINSQDGTMYPNLISVYVVKSNGSQITNITPSNGSGWQFSYSVDGGDTWTTISSDQIQTEGDNGMLFKATNGTIMLNECVPIVRSCINGLNGVTYSLQLSNISLSYVPADQNYNLQMSCNVNLYKNESAVNSTDANLYNLYMQINSNDITTLQYNTDHWDASVNATVQSKSSTITIYAENENGAYLTSMIIPVSSSQAYVKELSSEEVVIMDGDAIVAGMTSSKDIDSKSDLNGKVMNKGGVRIWAGKMQTTGDLTTAYTTIDSNGSIVMQNIQQGKSIKLNPQQCSFKIIGPVSITNDSYTDGTYLPSSDERIELANFEYTIDPDSLYSAIRLIMKSFGKIIIDPLDREISVYSNKSDNKGFNCSSITEQSIRLYGGNGRPYIDLNGHDVAGNDFVTLTNSYNNKGLHLKRINNASSDDILYILDGLPTSDPKIEGVLWMDADRTLKVSSRGFGHENNQIEHTSSKRISGD